MPTSPSPRPLARVLLCGAGAVGSTYASLLHAADPGGLALLAGGERRARLLGDGLLVNGRRLAPRVVAPGEEAPPADLVLLAVKQHHLPAAVEALRGHVGPATLLVSLLNGVSSEGVLAAAFGEANVLPAFVVGTDAVRVDGETRYSRTGRVVLGARSNDPADGRVAAVRARLEGAGIPCEVPADILREQWWKWMLNVGVNQVSAVLRAPYGAFAAVPEVAGLARAAALEAVAVAQAEGVALGPGDVDRIFPILATLSPAGKTSMLQDVEAGRKTEVELFAGTVLTLGARHGIATPVNALLGQQLVALERLAGARP